MRVLLVSFHFIEYTIELANALSETVEVGLILNKNAVEKTVKDGLRNLLHKDIQTHLIDCYKKGVKDVRTLYTVYKIIKITKKFNPDIIHLQETTKSFLPLCWPFLRSYPLVLTVHDPEFHIGEDSNIPWRRNFVRDLVRKNANRIIVHGEKLRDAFIQLTRRDENEVYVIPHGCLFTQSDQGLQDIDYRKNRNNILFFGRIHQYKGLKYLIEAEPIIRQEIADFKIIIAGTGSDLHHYRNQLDQNNHFVIHDRYIPNEMIPELFRQATIVALPYIEASQSGVIAIAYTFGRPVVATDVGSLTEVVEDGITGYIVPPKDPIKLAQAILKILKNDSEREEMGQKAYEKAKNELAWPKIAEKTIQVYNDILNR